MAFLRRADLIDQVAQSDEIAQPLAHLERFAVLIKPHHLRQLDIKRHLAIAERRNGRLHPFDIAAMIGAEDIDQCVKAPRDLVIVIGNIRRKVGPAAV